MKGKAVNILVILIISLSIISSASAQGENDTKEKVVKTPPPEKKDCPSEEACKLWEEFKEKYGGNWKVHWNEHTETPESVYGSVNLGMGNITTEDKAKEAIWNFISDNKDFLKADLSGLRLARVQRDEGTWSVGYDQFYQGVPIYRGGIGATISDRGNLLSFGSSFYPDINLSTTPTISENESSEIAKDEVRSLGLTVDNSTQIVETSLLIFPEVKDNSIDYYLTWKVSLHSRFEWGYVFFIDAHTGEIVQSYSTAEYIRDNMTTYNKSTNDNKVLLGVIGVLILILILLMAILVIRRRH